MNTYYVVYEDSNTRKISSSLDSLPACSAWINKAKAYDQQIKAHYHYSVVQDVSLDPLKAAFQSLMGINGDRYRNECIDSGMLSQASYDAICENVSHNGIDSIIEHFGIVHWYYLNGLKKH